MLRTRKKRLETEKKNRNKQKNFSTRKSHKLISYWHVQSRLRISKQRQYKQLNHLHSAKTEHISNYRKAHLVFANPCQNNIEHSSQYYLKSEELGIKAKQLSTVVGK